eukprot:5723384-Amphidinium_carterae.3
MKDEQSDRPVQRNSIRLTLPGSFDSYGKVGANCQHFAIDFIKDIGADCSWLITDDERAAQATGGIVGTGFVCDPPRNPE